MDHELVQPGAAHWRRSRCPPESEATGEFACQGWIQKFLMGGGGYYRHHNIIMSMDIGTLTIQTNFNPLQFDDFAIFLYWPWQGGVMQWCISHEIPIGNWQYHLKAHYSQIHFMKIFPTIYDYCIMWPRSRDHQFHSIFSIFFFFFF